MTPEVIRKLEDAFLIGCTDLEACFAAGIGKTAFYVYCQENPDFAERKEALKQNPVYEARKVILDAIRDGKDVASAHKLIDRKEGSKVAVTGAEGGPLAVAVTEIKFVEPED